LEVRLRAGNQHVLLKSDDGYLDQVIICGLIMCSNLCGKPISSSLSSRPYKRDSIYLSLLHDNIKTIAGQVAAHFKQVEKVLSDGSLSVLKTLEKVISPMMKGIFQKRVLRPSADVNFQEYILT